jgi:hypothetical protein
VNKYPEILPENCMHLYVLLPELLIDDDVLNVSGFNFTK